MNLFEKSSGIFPLPASLFMCKDGKPYSTWDWLANDKKHLTGMVIDKQTEYESRLMTCMIYNMVDPNLSTVNPFKGNAFAAQVMARVHAMQDPGYDPAEKDRWMSLIKPIAIPGNYFVPTIYCGDDRATTRNKAFVDWFTPQVIRALYPYSAAFNLTSEAGKSWNPNEIDYVASLCKAEFEKEPKLEPKPILVHQQGTNIGTVADGLMYEFSKNPWDAHEFTIDDVVREARTALLQYPKLIWFQELAIHCEEQWARDMAGALRDLAKSEPRIIGLPGPV